MSQTRQQAERARQAFRRLSGAVDRTRILQEIASALRSESQLVFEANAKDLSVARDLPASLYKRLVLDEAKLKDVADGIDQLAAMDDPVGQVLAETELDEGLILRKVQTPIGVIAAIFESRPDVVPQIAALAIRSGNAVLLKGGREAANTNAVLGNLVRAVLGRYGVADAVQMISTRKEMAELLEMDELISLVVPRGSNEMVRTIQRSTRIPVLGHAAGICHVYIDEHADVEKAIRIAVDSKAQYPAVCNAAETLLIHRKFREVDQVVNALTGAGVDLRFDRDFGVEFSDLIMAIKLVDSIDEAIDHIHRFGSAHTDAIVTEDETAAHKFLDEVDSAGVYWNASTRFADGFRYGFGAEVGISTNKTHARGPVGVNGLLIYKYQLIGHGHIVETYTGKDARPFLHRRLK